MCAPVAESDDIGGDLDYSGMCSVFRDDGRSVFITAFNNKLSGLAKFGGGNGKVFGGCSSPEVLSGIPLAVTRSVRNGL